MRGVFNAILLAAILLIFAAGCGSSHEKGINSGKDRPKPAEKGG
jgi:hypothetical protein